MSHPTKNEHDRRTINKLRRELGQTILTSLQDPLVEDLARNSDGWLWIKKQGQPWERLEEFPDIQTENILRAVASSLSMTITPDHPYLDGELIVDGSRIHGNLPPETRRPSFTIRKRPTLVFSLDDYVKQGTLSKDHCEILLGAIKNHRNIFVVGSTGSGKTTLVNALIDSAAKITPEDRFVIIEDTGEIQCAAPNTEQLYTTHNRNLDQLVKETLRMRPDRIIIGEVRGSEALNLLEIWNTGHNGGIATAHADSATPLAGLERIEMLVSRANSKLSNNFIRRLIGTTVHLIVCIEHTKTGREVNNITIVKGYEEGSYQLKNINKQE
jgi:type IV secretion system protein VirB11